MEQSQRNLNDMENQASLHIERSNVSDFQHSDSDEEVEKSDESDSEQSDNNDEEIENSDESDSEQSDNNDEEIGSSDESDSEQSDSDEEIESDFEHTSSDEEIGSSDESDFGLSDDDEVESSDESDFEDSDNDEEIEVLSKEETATEYFNEIDWTDEIKNHLLTPHEEWVFDGGPIHDLSVGSTPLQFLKLFFTVDFCEWVKHNINKFAELEQERKKAIDAHWKPIDSTMELWRFFCIIMYSGIIRVPSFNDYWADDGKIGVPAVKKLMSGERFQKILHYFCIVDAHNNEPEDGGTFTQAVKPIIEDIRARYLKHFKLTKELSMSKVLIENKESFGVFKHKHLEQSKSGLKIWTLSSLNRYVFDFDICTGKIPQNERSKNRLRHVVASRLLVPIKSSGHHIYLDRFFSSVSLMIDLFQKGYRAGSCIRIGGKRTPKELQTLKLKEPGDYQPFQCIQYPDMLCCVCGYRNKSCVISTNSTMESVEMKMRERSKTFTVRSKTFPVRYPSAIAKYNTYMRNVKLALPFQDYYNRLEKSSKWWRHLFWFLLETSLKNAYTVYTSTNTPRNQNSKGFLYFKLRVIKELLPQSKVANPSCSTTSEPEQSPSTSPTLAHQKVKIEGKRPACERCIRLKSETAANYHVPSSYTCNTCQVSLCVSCFDAYHSENLCDPVSLEDQESTSSKEMDFES